MDVFGKTLFCLPKTAPICFLLMPHSHWECRAHGNKSANQTSEQQLSWAAPTTTWGKENSQKHSNAWSSSHTNHFVYNSLLRTNHFVSHDFKVSPYHVKGGRTWNTYSMIGIPTTDLILYTNPLITHITHANCIFSASRETVLVISAFHHSNYQLDTCHDQTNSELHEEMKF